MESIDSIMIRKNRGWRGLAEVNCYSKGEEVTKMIFSFSQAVWNDLLYGVIVIQDRDNYTILQFNNTACLPKPTQQRSVLIKYFKANVVNSWTYNKEDWRFKTMGTSHYDYIDHFIKNRNNHTTSDWNYIGIRVVPMI